MNGKRMLKAHRIISSKTIGRDIRDDTSHAQSRALKKFKMRFAQSVTLTGRKKKNIFDLD
jgi:hypothetical protein